MTLFETKIELAPEDRKQEFDFYFTAPEGLQRIIVCFSYFPKNTSEQERCFPLITQCFEKYWSAEQPRPDWKSFLPLDNLITVSLYRDDAFVGCAHRHNPEQEHIISSRSASPGFLKQGVLHGAWQIVISAHEIVTPTVNVHVSARGL